MVKAIMESDTGSIDVDLALFSLTGTGKSTLVKALCYQHDIFQYFLDGFLWLKFGLGTVNHHRKLMDIYHQLTAMTFTGDHSVLVDKLKNLVTNHLQRLLVIMVDVHRSEDVMLYLEIFKHCKVIMLSIKEELFSLIPTKHKIILDWRYYDIFTSIKLLTVQVKGFEKINSELFAQLKNLIKDLVYWPVLLGIIHHQLLLYCNRYNLSPNSALQKVIQKLLTVEKSKSSCLDFTEPIIEGSLEFLGKEDLVRLNELVFYGGMEHITPKSLLPYVWRVSEEVANQCIELLYSCGLVQYTEKLLSSETTYTSVPCVEMHSIVYQHLFFKMNSNFTV